MTEQTTPPQRADDRATAGPTRSLLGARDRARAEVMSELLAAARARLESEGSAALSLRAVARDLGMASSAVYRHVPSRDALLTLLIIEAYDAVGEVAEKAAAGSDADPAQTWLEVARAVRRWALDQPHSFELIYGTPVRGYRAPDDTVRPAVRVWEVIIGLLLAAARDGILDPAGPDFDPTGRMAPEALATAGFTDPTTVPDDVARIAVRSGTLFTSLVGAISVELFGHLHRVAGDYERFFDVTVATAAAGVGLRITLD
ncbi:TetR/AcrR family transcriptional regulator [Cellulomonas sp. Leaf334]|uniref:TetR/AcrR family transcriptional regulator n=1 Tax=Cellulomonas sp. Leaf334 TaxID=1736339 RepID=UPI000A993055|nr:TetR/AcrR family transcriptional regulator [Cellulomonas sp. Leaf334]